MKVALITDTHFGVRGDNIAVLNHQQMFFDQIFFPYLQQHNISKVFHLGDLVDRRKFININTAARMRSMFIDPLLAQYDTTIICGNHDTYYKDTNKVNSLDQLLSQGEQVKLGIHTGPATIEIDGKLILLLPWICADNYQLSRQSIENTNATIVFGHLELSGFEMYRGSICEEGAERSIFSKFDHVFSGHFHHKSKQDNITYLGTPFQMTWADFDDIKGFHVFDTDTEQLEFVANPFQLFQKIVYDDQDTTMVQLLDIDTTRLSSTYVKVIIKNKTNPYWFDLFIDKLEKANVIDVQVVDDHHNLIDQTDEQIFDQAEDVLTMLNNSISTISASAANKKQAQILIRSLYNQALLNEA